MSIHDDQGWRGASPAEVFAFLRGRGFSLCYLRICADPLGCDEYVFERGQASSGHGDPAVMR